MDFEASRWGGCQLARDRRRGAVTDVELQSSDADPVAFEGAISIRGVTRQGRGHLA
jgi:hypothetical protein